MKKVLIIMLALVLCVSCVFAVGCGGKVVKDGDKIVVGITDYKPMDYLDSDGNWTGFDYELAKKTFEELGYTVEFKEIDWDTKIVTLNAGTIDCIWNGMTVTDELLNNLLLSNVYLKNQQYAVVKVANASSYTSTASLSGKKVAVESGSAAESAVKDLGASSVEKLTNQNSAIMAVQAGTADVAIVDRALAMSMTAQGTDYYGQLVAKDIGFAEEEFAIAFRQSDSKLCWNVNKKIASYYKDGTIATLAEKYGLSNSLVID